MKKARTAAAAVALIATALTLTPPPVTASASEPYLSIRTGMACSSCHVNRTGGGMRTDFGVVYAQTRLPARIVGAVGSEGSFLSPRVGEIALGVDLRTRVSRRLSGGEPRTPFDVNDGNLYIAARAVPERLTIYADEEVSSGGMRTREFFALVEGIPGGGYVKAGRFFPPFGVRLVDDDEFIRQRTGFNFANPDIGFEVGFEPGPFSVAVAVTNGSQGGEENDDDKQVSGIASLVTSRLRLGVTGSRNDASAGRREIVGAFGGVRLGSATVLGEIDLIDDDPPPGRRGDQLVGFIEADLLVARGLNVKATYGFLDPDRDIGENARVRSRFGVEYFAAQFLQASFFYTLLDDIPQSRTDRDEVSLELHAFF